MTRRAQRSFVRTVAAATCHTRQGMVLCSSADPDISRDRTLTGTARVAWRGHLAAIAVVVVSLTATGCRQDMHDQPRFEALEQNTFFADGRAARPQVAGTVARGELRADKHFFEGTVNGEPAATFPIEVTANILARGRERYEINCSPCHGRLGDGNGMVAMRGFRHPPSYHSERLRGALPGYCFDVITNGFGSMMDFSDRVTPADRWAIAAYIRALQFSQHAPVAQLPANDLEQVRNGG